MTVEIINKLNDRLYVSAPFEDFISGEIIKKNVLLDRFQVAMIVPTDNVELCNIDGNNTSHINIKISTDGEIDYLIRYYTSLHENQFKVLRKNVPLEIEEDIFYGVLEFITLDSLV